LSPSTSGNRRLDPGCWSPARHSPCSAPFPVSGSEE
jgi:hypothetical protein